MVRVLLFILASALAAPLVEEPVVQKKTAQRMSLFPNIVNVIQLSQ